MTVTIRIVNLAAIVSPNLSTTMVIAIAQVTLMLIYIAFRRTWIIYNNNNCFDGKKIHIKCVTYNFFVMFCLLSIKDLTISGLSGRE